MANGKQLLASEHCLSLDSCRIFDNDMDESFYPAFKDVVVRVALLTCHCIVPCVVDVKPCEPNASSRPRRVSPGGRLCVAATNCSRLSAPSCGSCCITSNGDPRWRRIKLCSASVPSANTTTHLPFCGRSARASCPAREVRLHRTLISHPAWHPLRASMSTPICRSTLDSHLSKRSSISLR